MAVPFPVRRMTGAAGAASTGSIDWVLDEWSYEETTIKVEIPAAGDIWTAQEAIRKQWTASISGYLSAVPPYTNVMVPNGTEVAIVLQALSTDSNGLVEATGLVIRARITSPATGAFRIEAEIEGSNGATGSTFDTSPA